MGRPRPRTLLPTVEPNNGVLSADTKKAALPAVSDYLVLREVRVEAGLTKCLVDSLVNTRSTSFYAHGVASSLDRKVH